MINFIVYYEEILQIFKIFKISQISQIFSQLIKSTKMGPIAKCGRKCHQSTDLDFDRKRNNKNKRIKNLMNSFKMEVNTGIYINAEGVRIDARDW